MYAWLFIMKYGKIIDEIPCIFQKVLFSLVKNIKRVISLVKYIKLDDFRSSHVSFVTPLSHFRTSDACNCFVCE